MLNTIQSEGIVNIVNQNYISDQRMIEEQYGFLTTKGLNDTNVSYDDIVKIFVQRLKEITHAYEVQIYTGELMQIYRESIS